MRQILKLVIRMGNEGITIKIVVSTQFVLAIDTTVDSQNANSNQQRQSEQITILTNNISHAS